MSGTPQPASATASDLRKRLHTHQERASEVMRLLTIIAFVAAVGIPLMQYLGMQVVLSTFNGRLTAHGAMMQRAVTVAEVLIFGAIGAAFGWCSGRVKQGEISSAAAIALAGVAAVLQLLMALGAVLTMRDAPSEGFVLLILCGSLLGIEGKLLYHGVRILRLHQEIAELPPELPARAKTGAGWAAARGSAKPPYARPMERSAGSATIRSVAPQDPVMEYAAPADGSFERRETARACLVIVLLGLLVGLGAPFLSAIGDRASGIDTLRLLFVGVVQSFIYTGIAWMWLALSRAIRAGGMVSLWIAFVLSMLATLGCGFVAGASLITAFVAGTAALLIWTVMCGLLTVVYGYLCYHAMRTLWPRESAADSAAVRGDAMEQRVVGFFRDHRRGLIVAAQIAVVLIHVAYVSFATIQYLRGRNLGDPVARERPPLAVANEPLPDDLYDPAHGVPQAERAAIVRNTAKQWGRTTPDNTALDTLLRENGKAVKGERLAGPPIGGDQSAPPELYVQKFGGILKGDRWTPFQQFGLDPATNLPYPEPAPRWTYGSLQREIGRLRQKFPAATPLQLRAVYTLLDKRAGGQEGRLALPPVEAGPAGSIFVEEDGRHLRITPGGETFDDSPAALAQWQAFLESEGEQVSAHRVWKASPLGLLVDGLLGLLLAVLLAMRWRRSSLLKGASLVGGVLLVMAWCWFGWACVELREPWAPPVNRSVLFLLLDGLIVARFAEMWFPREVLAAPRQ